MLSCGCYVGLVSANALLDTCIVIILGARKIDGFMERKLASAPSIKDTFFYSWQRTINLDNHQGLVALNNLSY
jgi:hypothetical protein